uniref:Uncharacterized protein n=1 Tax=Physcomitrium patens TaxID=3218 RepID=A0A2K1KNV4_PHYPA|nr:hypothetical protein PHYPA_006344 [Physcomitrium patens]
MSVRQQSLADALNAFKSRKVIVMNGATGSGKSITACDVHWLPSNLNRGSSNHQESPKVQSCARCDWQLRCLNRFFKEV